MLELVAQEETGLESGLQELEDHALIYRERATPEEEYSFRHVLTQETVYQNILRSRREVLHEQVGKAMETLYKEGLGEYYEELAYHYDRSGSAEKAVKYLLEAGKKSSRAYLNDEAISYFKRVLERLEKPDLGAHKDWKFEALKELGGVYSISGRGNDAVETLRGAIALGREIGMTSRELARPYIRLMENIRWFKKNVITTLIEEALAIPGDDTESFEAVFMKAVSLVLPYTGEYVSSLTDLLKQHEAMIRNQPYSLEKGLLYDCTALNYTTCGDFDEAMRWYKGLERMAEKNNDVYMLGLVYQHIGLFYRRCGDFRRQISHYKKALATAAGIGAGSLLLGSLGRISTGMLMLGNLQGAEEYARKWLENAESVESTPRVEGALRVLGCIHLCREKWQEGISELQKAMQIGFDVKLPSQTCHTLLALGRVCLVEGKQEEAAEQFRKALEFGEETFFHVWVCALGGLEEACSEHEDFHAVCRRFRKKHPEPDEKELFVQWYLEPAGTGSMPRELFHDDFDGSMSPGWQRDGVFEDSLLTFNNGLEIHAANGRNLLGYRYDVGNLSAPRVLYPVTGDFAAAAACSSAARDKPAIGAVVIWKDEGNYLYVERGEWGRCELSLRGSVAGNSIVAGRGRLVSERVFLRLERVGTRVSALCSKDGIEWFTVGNTEFPAEDPVKIGLCAIGNINRTLVYFGAYPEGSAVRFQSFRLWGR